MSFLQFFSILWARRAIIIVAALTCFVAATAIGLLLPVRYTATSRLMLETVKPDPITGQVVDSKFARTYFLTQFELIKDYRVAGQVVDALGWQSSPELLASYNRRAPGDSRDFRRWLAQLIMDGTEVTQVDGSNIMEISYTSSDPNSARVIADTIRDAYVADTLGAKRNAAAKTAEWYEQQLGKVRTALTAANARKTAFERENDIVLQDDNSDIETARLRALSGASDAPAAAAAASVSPVAVQLVQIDAQIAAAQETLGPNHPDIANMRRQRAAIVAAGRQMTVTGPAAGPSISSMVRQQQAKVVAQRGKLETLRRLAADVGVLSEQYNATAMKAAGSRQQADSNDASLTLLGNAVTPSKAVFPNWPLILFGSIALGLGLGVLVALITELLSRRVRGIWDLDSTGAAVIAVLPRAETDARRGLLARFLPFGAQAQPA